MPKNILVGQKVTQKNKGNFKVKKNQFVKKCHINLESRK